jgi:hypothetical protein
MEDHVMQCKHHRFHAFWGYLSVKKGSYRILYVDSVGF